MLSGGVVEPAIPSHLYRRKLAMSDTENLTLLGQSKTEYPQTYSPTVLERFHNRYPQQDYVVELDCPEFTCLCPLTGQPDFAHIGIRYSPREFLVESKSLKLYLFSFRNKGEFSEDSVNCIARDLFQFLQPKWLEVRGEFWPRGGIAIKPSVRLADAES
jgi:7-cyano-7-deazaguanine reductase